MITKKRWVLSKNLKKFEEWKLLNRGVENNQLRSLAQITAKYVKEFYKDSKNLKKFEEWKLLNRGVENEDKS